MSKAENSQYDLIIAGAGPAGLSAAQYAARAGMSVLILGNPAGSQAARISSLENYPGIFPASDGFSFLDAMKRQALEFGAKAEFKTVSSIVKSDSEEAICTVNADGTEYTAGAVLIATGAEHRKLGIPGEQEFLGRGVSYCATCDGPFFRGKDVIVIGGGDSACAEALFLSKICRSVTVIHRKSQFRAQKSLAQSVLNSNSIKVLFNCTVERIDGTEKVETAAVKNSADGTSEKITADGIFISIGTVPAQTFFSGIKTDESGYIVTDEMMQTSVPGIFAAGDIRSKSFRQVVTACSDGATAAHAAFSYLSKVRNEVYK